MALKKRTVLSYVVLLHMKPPTVSPVSGTRGNNADPDLGRTWMSHWISSNWLVSCSGETYTLVHDAGSIAVPPKSHHKDSRRAKKRTRKYRQGERRGGGVGWRREKVRKRDWGEIEESEIQLTSNYPVGYLVNHHFSRIFKCAFVLKRQNLLPYLDSNWKSLGFGLLFKQKKTSP